MFHVRYVAWRIQTDHRFAVYPDIPLILHVFLDVTDKILRIFFGVVLPDENIVFQSIPGSCPVFICPDSHEGHINLFMLEQQIQRLFQQAMTRKPVIVNSKAVDTMSLRQLYLLFQRFHVAQIIITEIVMRDSWLIMFLIAWPAFTYVCPFRKAFAPPCIILRESVELGQVQSQRFDVRCITGKVYIFFIIRTRITGKDGFHFLYRCCYPYFFRGCHRMEMLMGKVKCCLNTIVFDGLKATEYKGGFPSSTEACSEHIGHFANRLGDFPAIRRNDGLVHAHGTVVLIGCLQILLLGTPALLLQGCILLLQCRILLIQHAIFLLNPLDGSLIFLAGHAHGIKHSADNHVSGSFGHIMALRLAKHLIQQNHSPLLYKAKHQFCILVAIHCIIRTVADQASNPNKHGFQWESLFRKDIHALNQAIRLFVIGRDALLTQTGALHRIGLCFFQVSHLLFQFRRMPAAIPALKSNIVSQAFINAAIPCCRTALMLLIKITNPAVLDLLDFICCTVCGAIIHNNKFEIFPGLL